MDTSLLTEAGNNIFIIGSAVMALYCFIWLTRNDLKNGYSEVVIAWMLVFGAVMFRIGYWTVAHKLAPEGYVHSPLMFEWRWLNTLITSLWFVAGIYIFVSHIEEYQMKTKLWAIGVGVGAAFLVAMI